MLSLASCIVASSMALGQAETKTTMPAGLQEQIEKYLIGALVFEASFGEQRITGSEFWSWEASKSALIIEGCFDESGKKSPYICVGGWDSGKACLVVTGYVSDGDMWITRWTEFSPQGWKGTISGTYQGQPYESPAKIEFSDKSIRYQDTTAGKPWVSVGRRLHGIPQNEGNKAFTSFMELAVGGVWTTTVDNVKVEHSYQQVSNAPFVQLTMKGGTYAGTATCGLDPKSGNFTRWSFFEDGTVFKDVISQESDGVWMFQGSGTGPMGNVAWKLRVKRVDANTVDEEGLEHVVGGVQQPLDNLRWIRKR